MIGAGPSPARLPRYRSTFGAEKDIICTSQPGTNRMPPSPRGRPIRGRGGLPGCGLMRMRVWVFLSRPSVVGACYQMACSVADPPPLFPPLPLSPPPQPSVSCHCSAGFLSQHSPILGYLCKGQDILLDVRRDRSAPKLSDLVEYQSNDVVCSTISLSFMVLYPSPLQYYIPLL